MKCANKPLIEDAPSTGEWLSAGSPGWTCSNCGEHIVLDIFRWGNYCPNCGAKMHVNVSTVREMFVEVNRKAGEVIGYKVDSSK